MAGDLALFSKFTECDPEPVGGIQDGNRGLFATGFGEVRLKAKDDNGNNMPVLLKNVLYVPGICVNLISISHLQAGGLATLFAGEGVRITLPDGQYTRAAQIGRAHV